MFCDLEATMQNCSVSCLRGSDSSYSLVSQPTERPSTNWIQRLLDRTVEVKTPATASPTPDLNNNNNSVAASGVRFSGSEVVTILNTSVPDGSCRPVDVKTVPAELSNLAGSIADTASMSLYIPPLLHEQEEFSEFLARNAISLSISNDLTPPAENPAEDDANLIDISAIKRLAPAEKSYMVANRAGLYSNDQLEVLFDTPTPRPHLIIKYKRDEANKRNQWNKNPINKSILEFDDEELRGLIVFVLEFVVNYLAEFVKDYSSLILSFHTGHWASTKEFHCHLCMDMESYLALFNKFKIIGPILPSSKWELINKKLSTKQQYIENVKNFEIVKIRSSLEYKNNEIDAINNNANVDSQGLAERDKKYLHDFQMSNPDVYIAFDSSEPKLKFKTNKPADYMNLLRKLCKYADDNGYFSKPNGCHICVNIADPFGKSSQTEGYLHMAADQYHRIHPLPLIFLEKFMNKEDYYIST